MAIQRGAQHVSPRAREPDVQHHGLIERIGSKRAGRLVKQIGPHNARMLLSTLGAHNLQQLLQEVPLFAIKERAIPISNQVKSRIPFKQVLESEKLRVRQRRN